MKYLLLSLAALVILILDNIFFDVNSTIEVHIVQVILLILGIALLIISIINLEKSAYINNYKIPLFIGFSIMMKNIESIISKLVSHYYPSFYDTYKVSIFLGCFLVFIAVVYYYRRNQKIKEG